MPSDEYTGAAGGALKLKGGKIQKSKKKKSKSKDKDVSSKLERSSRSTSAVAESKDDNGNVAEKAATPATETSDHEEDHTTEYKTEAERRHEEAMKKRVSKMRLGFFYTYVYVHYFPKFKVNHWLFCSCSRTRNEALRGQKADLHKQMQRMLEDPALASEIRKTHKERVESLNTYLSKLSEHHDMPKIGPG